MSTQRPLTLTAPLLNRERAAVVLGALIALGLVVAQASNAAQAATAVVFVLLLAAVSITDLQARRIPYVILVPAGVVLVPLVWASDPGQFPAHAATAVGVGVLMSVYCIIGIVNAGDMKLSIVIGLVLGPAASILALLLTFLATAAVAVISRMRVRRGHPAINDFAGAPLLAATSVIALLAAEPLVHALQAATGAA